MAEASKNARARRAGKDWERQLRDYEREAGLDVESLRATGTFDEGDLVVRAGGYYFVQEAKNEKDYALAGYVAEAAVEGKNFAKHRSIDQGRVFNHAVVKRRGAPIGKGYVVHTEDEFIRLILTLTGKP